MVNVADAKALRASLFDFGRGGGAKSGGNGGVRSGDWPCGVCSYLNWGVRQVCRVCKGGKVQAGRVVQQRGVQVVQGRGGLVQRGTGLQRGAGGGAGKGKGAGKQPEAMTWAEKVQLAQVKAQSLEQVAAAARRAGSATAGQLAQEAKQARVAAAEGKPLHVRLQRMDERLTAATAKVNVAREAAEQAQRRLEQAEGHLQAVGQDKETLQKELSEMTEHAAQVTRPPRGQVAGQLASAVQTLLSKLEQGRTPEGCDETQDVVGKLHALLEQMRPTPAGRLDEALVDDGTRGQKRGADDGAELSDYDEDRFATPALPQEMLDGFDESAFDKTDTELADMTRAALKKQRQPAQRQAPY